LPNEGAIARCEDVVKVYATQTSEVRALRGVSARFGQDALTVVAGPSGSGKSSLLRILAGIDRPTDGLVDVAGVRVSHAGWGTLRRLRAQTVGYIFQRASDNFLSYLTVREHLAFAERAAPGRLSLEEITDALGLTDRLEHLPRELSGGEQARAAMAQVLAAGASLVIADEPTAELDSASAKGLVGAMTVLLERGVSFVVASHDPALRWRADELVELEHGELRRRSAPPQQELRDGRGRSAEPVHLSSAGEPVVRARGVAKSYRRGDEVVHAVTDVTMEVRAGELVALIGRSGSGKSTLLNLIGGWEAADRGTIEVFGDGGARPTAMWKDVAVLPQRLGLLDELTIRENVEYPARLAGEQPAARERADRLLENLGLDALADRYPRETSIGEQQRSALARALVLSPRLLLVDEPTSHQDEVRARFVLGELRRAAIEGTACLVATHDEAAVRGFDLVLSMADGRLSDPRG
jgi:putative ABC transport system ATP-binding protein